MELLTTNEAAKILRVSPIRVRQLIREGKIRAKQVGRDYVIEESSLDSVKTYGKAGRPAKETESKNGSQIAFKTAFDIAPDLMRRLLDKQRDLPADLSINKEYLKDLGKKSAEKKALPEGNDKLNED
jgi:excisionase family DNA binding protein